MLGHQIITGRKKDLKFKVFPPVRLSKENTNRKKNMPMMLEQIRLYVVYIPSTKEKSSMRIIINM